MVDRDYKPFGSVRDAMDAMAKLDQAGTNAEIRSIRALLEREVKKGDAKANELAALMDKHVCPRCIRGRGSQRATASCSTCRGDKKRMFRESEIPYKDRMNLEPLKMPCKSCNGSGSRDGRTACSNCGGAGEETIYRVRGSSINESRLPARTGKEPMYACPSCNGTGNTQVSCPLCNDTGIVNRAEYEVALRRIEVRYR